MSETGWFADVDKRQSGEYRWQPCLQLEGMCVSIELWFSSEQACQDFIEQDVAGKGLLDA